MNTSLIDYIRRYIDLSDEECDLFHSFLKPRKIKKKEHLLQAGDICKSRYYISEGCVRLYYFDKKTNEQIIHFAIDNWWTTDYDSLINQAPSGLFIQAIEDTKILELRNESFEKLCNELPRVERLFRIIMEKTFIASQRRTAYMLSQSGKELYDTFTSENLGFTQRIPQYMLASYLGMTPEFISKLRAGKN
ncbi:MAG: Crp/Fnr family transcriptional regulator [Cyclobacteriaceae bacterium]